MAEALRFFREYEIWIYMVAGALAVWQIGKFILAWRALSAATFGLEREHAQYRVNAAAALLVLLLMTVVAEFILVSFVAPSVPGAIPIPTSTLNLLATPTTTLPPRLTTVVGTGTPQPVSGTSSTASQPGDNGCIPGKVMLTSPKDGEEIRDVVTLMGTVNILNFGFYKYEVARPGDAAWLTIGGGRSIVVDGKLGDWDTTTRIPGEYLLQLVVTDNQGQYLPACVIRVRIAPPATP
jgi:hypothetical protein